MWSWAPVLVGGITVLIAIGGILFKLVRWGLRQDNAIYNLERSHRTLQAKCIELERRALHAENRVTDLEWSGRVYVFPRAKQRWLLRMEREERERELLKQGPTDEEHEPENDEEDDEP